MSCILRARGTNFAVDEFLSTSRLKPNVVARRGQPLHPNFPPGSPIPNASGFHAVASEADFSRLQVQIAEAVHFLEQNQAELQRLVAFPDVERVSLDFGIEERDIAGQRERFPPNLLRILGNLGIWLEFTLYPQNNPETERTAPE
jgi:hypothetical protein